MTPEMRMAQFLSGNDETEKIQAEVRGFSIEELEGLLKTGSVKTANGDMLQYFQDHPEKLKEKQERDVKKAEKEKKAFTVDHLKAGAGMAATGVAGYALGKHHGKKEKKSSSEPETNEADSSKIKADMEKDEKLSPQELMKKADAMGRELAHKEKVAISFNQINEGTKIPGRLLKAYERVKEPVGRALKVVGGKAHGAVKALGAHISNINDPIVKGMATGAAIGGIGGATTGAILPDKDEAGNPQRTKTMLRKGLAGTLTGATQGSLMGAMQKSSSALTHGLAAGGALVAGGVAGHALGKSRGLDQGTKGGFQMGQSYAPGAKLTKASRETKKALPGSAWTVSGQKHASVQVQKLQATLEKNAAGLNMAGIGSMAKNFVGSMQSVGQKAMGAVKPMAQKAMGAVKPMAQKAFSGAALSGAAGKATSGLYSAGRSAGAMSTGARAGIGAGVGAGLGAAKGLVAPGRDVQGQQKGRLGAMTRGAVGGAALGAGAGAIAPKALTGAADVLHGARVKALNMPR